RLARALPLARRSIRIVGWDFDPDIRLRPPDGPTLGEMLRSLVEATPGLEVHILVWAMGPIYSGHSLKLFNDNGWSSHPRISLRFDTRHAWRGCHHQKLVTIDDCLAFVGGIDLTAGRWDSCAHEAESSRRAKPNGSPYGPVHDVQATLTGPAARSIAEPALWLRGKATREAPEPVESECVPWPENVAPELEGCTVAIGRTVPSLPGIRRRREAIRLTHAAIAAARRSIYIESQYLASFSVGNALAQRLRE